MKLRQSHIESISRVELIPKSQYVQSPSGMLRGPRYLSLSRLSDRSAVGLEGALIQIFLGFVLAMFLPHRPP